jgi:hypothetical protein
VRQSSILCTLYAMRYTPLLQPQFCAPPAEPCFFGTADATRHARRETRGSDSATAATSDERRAAVEVERRGATANPHQAPPSTPAAAAPTHTSTGACGGRHWVANWALCSGGRPSRWVGTTRRRPCGNGRPPAPASPRGGRGGGGGAPWGPLAHYCIWAPSTLGTPHREFFGKYF